MAKTSTASKPTKKSTTRQQPAQPERPRLPYQGAPERHDVVMEAPAAPPPDNPIGRPVRANRGIGGQRMQLEKTSEIVGKDLLNKLTGVTGQKRSRHNPLTENLPENHLAPPIPTKRLRTSKAAVSDDVPPSRQTSRVTNQVEPPLQAAPKPVLKIANFQNSPYGFPQRTRHVAGSGKKPMKHAMRHPSAPDALQQQPDCHDVRPHSSDKENAQVAEKVSADFYMAKNIDDMYVGYDDHDNNTSNNGDEDEDKDKDEDEDEDGDDDGPPGVDDDDDVNEGDEPVEGDCNNDTNGACDIDEVSPSEDERRAEDFLKKASESSRHIIHTPENDDDTPQDVLARHHQKNRSNRPPQLETLSNAANYQMENHKRNNTAAQDDAADEESSDEQVRTRAPRHSKSTGEAKPDTLVYYRGTPWSSILIWAKVKYSRHIALYHGFPDRDKHLADATKILAEAIEEFRNEGAIIDAHYKQTREMNCLVFKEGATFRGRLKTIAQNLVEQAFRDELHPSEYFESQRDLQICIERNVADLLEGGEFLKNGKDDMGRTNNLANPCIGNIVIKFFYSGKHALARSFPADFRNTIPDHAIALVATVMKHCLSQYATGMFFSVKFEGIFQDSIYNRMLTLIDQVKSDPYHKAKYDANRRRWATLGMQEINPHVERETHDLDVVLD